MVVFSMGMALETNGYHSFKLHLNNYPLILLDTCTCMLLMYYLYVFMSNVGTAGNEASLCEYNTVSCRMHIIYTTNEQTRRLTYFGAIFCLEECSYFWQITSCHFVPECLPSNLSTCLLPYFWYQFCEASKIICTCTIFSVTSPIDSSVLEFQWIRHFWCLELQIFCCKYPMRINHTQFQTLLCCSYMY